MKITIQHHDETASLEVPDGASLDEFRDNLLRLLHVIWLPEQVAEIMRVKDWDEGYAAGLEKALENDELQEDKERLDWIFQYCGVTYDTFFSTSFVNREEVDKAMEEIK